MPSGARTMEHGRPFRWPIIQPPTASKYRARSSLVTPSPSPPSGHSPLSGFEMTTPITSPDLLPAGLAAVVLLGLAADFPTEGWADLVMTGFSAFTSLAGLSLRSPSHAPCRKLPSPVQPA